MGFRGGGGLGSTSRTKRMRTSFKHHQLRTMKTYFLINHNPDAKDLKQLSQKTGLPKRVLQTCGIVMIMTLV
ncbi:Apterous [Operophtera brumata]|uniref:Apterous n=1 Tax=Operophtera brumata TaxID=104452 RepID=A0A0L7LTV2_OPEBR|nr:Apterous [Operophtera brumata]